MFSVIHYYVTLPLFAVLVILCSNPLYSIISFIFLIVNSCIILFCWEVEFLTFILLLIYIGAIAVLFIFIVMLLHLDKEELRKNSLSVLTLDNIFYVILFVKLSWYFYFFNQKLWISTVIFSYEFSNFSESFYLTSVGNSKISIMDYTLFMQLFTHKYVNFLIVGIILLFSMVGSISLCIKKKN